MKKHKNMLVFVLTIAFIATVIFWLAPVNQQVAEAESNSPAAAPVAASQQERQPLEPLHIRPVGRDQRIGAGPGPLNMTELKRTDSDGSSWHVYGKSVAVGNALAAIASPGDGNGSVSVLRVDGNNWTPDSKLTASDGAEYDYFGDSVAVDGETVVVGSFGYYETLNSVYVFEWSGSSWNETKLTASDGEIYDRFGQSVSISGDVILVGAPEHGFIGSAYVYRKNGSSWDESKLTPDDADAYNYFGRSVSISGDVAIIGSYADDGTNYGEVAYVFRWNGSQWIQETKLTASDCNSFCYNEFGSSVSISGNVALVGAYSDNVSSGSAYLYRYNGTEWVEEQKLIASDGAEYDYFGYSVSVTDNMALVGAYGNNNSDDWGRGAAYLFGYNDSTLQWDQAAKLLASDGAQNDQFGASVSLSDGVAMAGAPGDNDHGSYSGSAYLYLLSSETPDPNMALSQSNFWVALKEDESSTESITIANSGSGTLNWSASSDSAWLSATPSSGSVSTTEQPVTLNINATDLPLGQYEGQLTITAGDSSSAVRVWLTVASLDDAPIVSPAYGFDNVPTLIYIEGSGFDESTTVMLGSQALEIKYVESALISALVPAGLDAGEYDVTVQSGEDFAIVPNGYEVIRSTVVNDLLSSSDWLWSDPQPLRLGFANSGVGVLVQHLGGRYSINEVTVEFRRDSPVGPLLGRERTNVIKPFGIESTGKVVWEPRSTGEYIVCAIIDPDNEVEESNEENNVACRTLTVLEGGPDVMPPVVENPGGFMISDDTLTTAEVTATLDIIATDNPSGSGVESLKYIEFEYILGAHRWVPVQRTPWITYTTAYSDYPWQLIPTFGMRYMQGWVADAAGNISLEPGVDVIDLLPSEQPGSVAQHGVDFYRILLEEGETFTATLEPVDGDPDLYVWGPNGQLWYDQPQTGVEQVTIDGAPVKGTYQIEVHGFTDADYLLNFGATDVPSSTLSSLSSIASPLQVRGREVPEEPAVPLDEWPEFYDVEAAPVAADEPPPPPNTGSTIYLPITIN